MRRRHRDDGTRPRGWGHGKLDRGATTDALYAEKPAGRPLPEGSGQDFGLRRRISWEVIGRHALDVDADSAPPYQTLNPTAIGRGGCGRETCRFRIFGIMEEGPGLQLDAR